MLLWTGLVSLVLAIFTLPSVLLAWFAHWKGPVLSRLENSLIVGGSVILFILDAKTILLGQPKWLGVLTTVVHGSAWPVPWLSIVATTAFYYGIAGLMRTSSVGGKVMVECAMP